jgi:hypothetical protein
MFTYDRACQQVTGSDHKRRFSRQDGGSGFEGEKMFQIAVAVSARRSHDDFSEVIQILFCQFKTAFYLRR